MWQTLRDYKDMKANELMLGDWVLDNGTPVRVEEIFSDGINGDWYRDECCGISFCEELKPIPITSYILTKNGFEMDGIGYYILNNLDGIANNYISVAFRHNGEVRAVCIDLAYFGVINTKTIHYVHELQQALRLIGKYDLANNFKV